jgi:hypothetical protein
MKKLFIILLTTFLLGSFVYADSITLTQEETISVPTTQKIGGWYIDYISAAEKTMTIKYFWQDAQGEAIYPKGSRTIWQSWDCKDRSADLNPVNNVQCTAAGVPDACCTGVGVGTCDDLTIMDSCFSDVFLFEIRPQDAGTTIGLGLRTLTWNEMKKDILTGGNDGSFD